MNGCSVVSLYPEIGTRRNGRTVMCEINGEGYIDKRQLLERLNGPLGPSVLCLFWYKETCCQKKKTERVICDHCDR